jgi:hypothetical protein
MWRFSMERPVKKYPTVGACGLDCGLCTKYYTIGKSRCPGCCGPDFFNKHPTCAFSTCCVKKKGLEACGECDEFPCEKFEKAADVQSQETSAYPPYRNIMPNLEFIREQGIKEFIHRQRKRIRLLERLIEDFDDGRSRSVFCRAASLMEVSNLRDCLKQATRMMEADNVEPTDMKARAKLLRGLLDEAAAGEGIELKVVRKK